MARSTRVCERDVYFSASGVQRGARPAALVAYDEQEARAREEEARKNVGPKPGPLKVVDEEAFQRFLNSCYEAAEKVSRCIAWPQEPRGKHGRDHVI